MSIDNQVLRKTVIDFTSAGRKFDSFFTFDQQTQAIFSLIFRAYCNLSVNSGIRKNGSKLSELSIISAFNALQYLEICLK